MTRFMHILPACLAPLIHIPPQTRVASRSACLPSGRGSGESCGGSWWASCAGGTARRMRLCQGGHNATLGCTMPAFGTGFARSHADVTRKGGAVRPAPPILFSAATGLSAALRFAGCGTFDRCLRLGMARRVTAGTAGLFLGLGNPAALVACAAAAAFGFARFARHLARHLRHPLILCQTGNPATGGWFPWASPHACGGGSMRKACIRRDTCKQRQEGDGAGGRTRTDTPCGNRV